MQASPAQKDDKPAWLAYELWRMNVPGRPLAAEDSVQVSGGNIAS
jgi:hypothetical protein